MIEAYEASLDKAVVAVKKYFSQQNLSNLSSQVKEDQSLLTRIDLEVNQILREILKDPHPEVGWQSEECKEDLTRVEKEYCWIVDPIDGTKELLKGVPESVVSVGLVHQGRPVLGRLYNPMSGEVFPKQGVEQESRSILVSTTDLKKGLFTNFNSGGFQFESCGSIAFKLGLVASGEALGTVSVTPKNEWDVAGGMALLNEVGGVMEFFDGRHLGTIRLNQENPLLPGFIAAGSDEVFAQLKSIFATCFEN